MQTTRVEQLFDSRQINLKYINDCACWRGVITQPCSNRITRANWAKLIILIRLLVAELSRAVRYASFFFFQLIDYRD